MHLSRLSPRLASLVVVTSLTLSLSGCHLGRSDWGECDGNVAVDNVCDEPGCWIEERDCDASSIPAVCTTHGDRATCEPPPDVPAPSAAWPLAWSDGVVSIAAESAELALDGQTVPYSGVASLYGTLNEDGTRYDVTVWWTQRSDFVVRVTDSFAADGEAWSLQDAGISWSSPGYFGDADLSDGLVSDKGAKIHAPLGVWWRGDLTLDAGDRARLTFRNVHFRAFE